MLFFIPPLLFILPLLPPPSLPLFISFLFPFLLPPSLPPFLPSFPLSLSLEGYRVPVFVLPPALTQDWTWTSTWLPCHRMTRISTCHRMLWPQFILHKNLSWKTLRYWLCDVLCVKVVSTMYVLVSYVNNSRVITDKRARVNFECLNFSNAKTIEPDDAVSGESLFLFLAFYLLNIFYYCHVSDHFCIYESQFYSSRFVAWTAFTSPRLGTRIGLIQS